MKSIFQYLNYRIFLKDYYTELKAEKKHFSYRYFSRRANINSPNFLKVVIEGKRNLSSKTIDKFAKAIGFNKSEAVFFRHLVLFNQAKTSSERRENFIILKEMAIHLQQNPGIDQNSPNHETPSWYGNAVREILSFKSFDGHISGYNQKSTIAPENFSLKKADCFVSLSSDTVTKQTPGFLTLWPKFDAQPNNWVRVQTFEFRSPSILPSTTTANL